MMITESEHWTTEERLVYFDMKPLKSDNTGQVDN